MESENEYWTVLTDRSQGCTKTKPDEIEIMVHRRLFRDDHFGVDEALNELAFGQPLVARGIHHVYKSQQDNPEWRRLKAQELYMAPIVMFQPVDLELDEWIDLDKGQKEFSMLKYRMSPNVTCHLMTIERWDNLQQPSTENEDEFEILLRFENLLEAQENEWGIIDVEIFSDNFVDLTIVNMVETGLGGDRPVVPFGLKWTKTSQKVPLHLLGSNVNF